ncbi:MAG: hypothetical protein U0800_10005 [Isosphaeraceae bacterium]
MMTVEAYERLEAAASAVANHASFRSKSIVVEACVHEVEDRFIRGNLSDSQRARLMRILNGESLPG